MKRTIESLGGSLDRICKIFPTIKLGLDFFHCSEYIYGLANIQYGKGTRKAQECVEATFVRLFHNRISDVICGIKRMAPASPEAEKKINDQSVFFFGNFEYLYF